MSEAWMADYYQGTSALIQTSVCISHMFDLISAETWLSCSIKA